MTVPDPPTQDIGRPDLGWGTTWGQGLVSDWWETAADLIFPQSIVTFGRMRHDLQIKAVNQAYVLPLLRANWMLDPEGCRDEVVKHVSDDLGIGILGEDKKPGPARRRGVVWKRHLRDALMELTYGFSPFERRYEIQPDGYARLIHLGPRPPWTIANMNVGPDGIVRAVTQTTQEKPISADRLVWYVMNQEGGNWAGISPLRAAYGAWLLKHEGWRVHATSIRRFGMGVPTVTAPQGASGNAVQQAQQLASAMRAGDQSGMGLPAGFTASLMGMSGGAPDALGWIKYLDQSIAESSLAGLLKLGQTETGSRALGESFLDLFFLSLQGVADELALTATSGQEGMPGIVTGLVDQNWGEDEPAPRIVCTDIGENHEATAAAIESLLTAKAIQPDPALEDYVRKTWRLPPRKGPLPSAQPPGQAGQPPPGQQGPGQPPQPPGPQQPPPPGPKQPKPPQPKAPTASFEAARQLTPVEVAAGFSPETHNAQWQDALDSLMSAYRAVWSKQKMELTDEAEHVAASGRGRLALTPPPPGRGPSLILDYMRQVARQAADAMTGEAMRQGVVIDSAKVKIDDARLSRIASARASLAASYLAQQASTAFLQVAAAAQPDPSQPVIPPAVAATAVATVLDGLSDTPLKDMLGAALTAAQNTGRITVMSHAPKNVPVQYVATEYLDRNTCSNCRAEDGHVFGTLAEAEAAYPMGGYKACKGFARCRGTIMALWQPQATASKWNPAEHPREPHGGSHGGEFIHKPGGSLSPGEIASIAVSGGTTPQRRQVARSLLEHQRRAPHVLVTKVTISGDMPKSGENGHWDAQSKEITLSSRLWDQDAQSGYEMALQDGYHPPAPDFPSVVDYEVAHEFGHAVTDQNFKAVEAALTENFPGQKTFGQVRLNYAAVSGYTAATASYQEAGAEVWASWTGGNKDPRFVKAGQAMAQASGFKAAKWEEKLHPRRPDGEFMHKNWAEPPSGSMNQDQTESWLTTLGFDFLQRTGILNTAVRDGKVGLGGDHVLHHHESGGYSVDTTTAKSPVSVPKPQRKEPSPATPPLRGNLPDSFTVQPGVPAEQVAGLKKAVGKIPGKAQAEITRHARGIELHPGSEVGVVNVEGVGEVHAAGYYDPSSRKVVIAAGNLLATQVAVHEAFHAQDHGGVYSMAAEWKALAAEIRKAMPGNALGLHYRENTDAAVSELWAEAAASYVRTPKDGQTWYKWGNDTRGKQLPARLRAKLDAYFEKTVGPRR